MKKTVLTKNLVSHIAKLAEFDLSDKQIDKYLVQLRAVLGYVDKLQQLKTENIEPTSQVTGLENVLREDEIQPSLTQEEVLSNAPRKYNGYFVVDAIFE
jgi:aspartyl-tRNA(Asn)/glutamyl-tRNA(Gln) amidotransferase subunit C